jgi:uncharacterized membrane protein
MEIEQLGEELSDQDRILLVFCYLGPLALVSLVATRREFVKWHAKQGLLVFGLLLVLYLMAKASQAWTWLANVLLTSFWMVAIGVVLAVVLCIIRGLEGERFKIPLLGDLADRL